MACNEATGYAKGMLPADHPELFQGWELDPASDSQILVEPASDREIQLQKASMVKVVVWKKAILWCFLNMADL